MRRLWLIFAQTVTVALAFLFVIQALKPEWLPSRPAPVTLQQAPTMTGDDEPTGPSTTTTTVADGQAPTATLPLDDTSVKGVSSMAGLVVPDAAKDFLTAATENAGYPSTVKR